MLNDYDYDQCVKLTQMSMFMHTQMRLRVTSDSSTNIIAIS